MNLRNDLPSPEPIPPPSAKPVEGLRQPRPLNEETALAALVRYEAGEFITDICQSYGIPHAEFRKFVKANPDLAKAFREGRQYHGAFHGEASAKIGIRAGEMCKDGAGNAVMLSALKMEREAHDRVAHLTSDDWNDDIRKVDAQKALLDQTGVLDIVLSPDIFTAPSTPGE